MNSVIQFAGRQCTVAAFLCLGFAFLQSFRVGEGLWQGSGLHGYVIEAGKAHGGLVISVWTSFVNMLIAFNLAAFFGLTAKLSRSSWQRKKRLL